MALRGGGDHCGGLLGASDTQAARGRKRHAKTDRSDAQLLRELFRTASCRSRGSRRRWCWSGGNGCGSTSRWSISARLGRSGSTPSCSNTAPLFPRVPSGGRRARATLGSAELELTAAARQRIGIGYSMIDAIDVLAKPLKADLQRFGQRQAGAALSSTPSTALVGCWRWRSGPSSATVDASCGPIRWCVTAVWMSRSIPRTVAAPAGSCSRQGPQTLRWALYEAAKNSSHHVTITVSARSSRWPHASSCGTLTQEGLLEIPMPGLSVRRAHLGRSSNAITPQRRGAAPLRSRPQDREDRRPPQVRRHAPRRRSVAHSSRSPLFSFSALLVLPLLVGNDEN